MDWKNAANKAGRLLDALGRGWTAYSFGGGVLTLLGLVVSNLGIVGLMLIIAGVLSMLLGAVGWLRHRGQPRDSASGSRLNLPKARRDAAEIRSGLLALMRSFGEPAMT